jgi:adhesin/invasin
MNVHRPALSVKSILFLLLSFLLPWISCTQKNPLEPASPLGNTLAILSGMSAAPSRIQTGGSKSMLQINLRDEDGKAISGATVSFRTSLGSLTRAGVRTDVNGWARDTLQSGTVPGLAAVTATYLQMTAVDTVEFATTTDTSSYILQLSTDTDEILANGTSTARLTINLVSQGTSSSKINTVVLSTTAGSVPASVIIGAGGQAEVELTSEAKSQDILAIVTAAFQDQAAAVSVRMKGVQFQAEANPLILFADGSSNSTVRAFLRESTTRIGIPGETVRFGTTLGSVQAQQNTDEFGVSTVQLIGGTTAGTAMVIARYGRTLLDTVLVEFRQSSLSVSLTSSSNAILANGIDYSTIRAVVKDAAGRALEDQSVYFAATAGDIDYVGTTDGAGAVEAKLISAAGPVDQTSTVTVTVSGVSKTIPILFKGIQFSLSANPNFLIANGTSQSVITAMIRETTNKIGVNLADVRFGTNLGTIPGSAISDNQGIAAVLLTSSPTQGTAQIVGRYGNLFVDTVLVQFGSSVPAGIQQITANPGYILANGRDQAWVSVKVVDAGNSPVVGTAVNFSASAGTILTQDVTDENGVAMVPLVSSENTTDVTSTVTARLGTQTVTTTVVFEGIQMSVNASPLAILADGRSTSVVTVVMKRSTSKIAIPNASLQFAADLGTIPAAASTSSEGVATVFLTSGTSIGTAHVTVTYGTSIRGTASVNFQESVPTYLEASATPPVLPADGQSQSVIKATVSDANRNPVPNGTIVQFDILSGSGSIERQKTTANGVATTQLTAGGTPGTTTVHVSVGSLTANVQVVYTVGQVYQVIVTSDRESMPADGIQVANIQATVVDAQGNPVSGQTVQFTASVGDITPNAPTNALGIAVGQFSSGIVGTATITAAVQRPSGGSISGTKIIQLQPGSSNTIVLKFDPIWIGVKDTGQNQTMNVSADIKDSKNNPVIDGTMVKFSFIGNNLGCALSTASPIPTVGGTATISLSSGTLAGSIRVKAEVVDAQGAPVNPPISATSTQLLIHAGPPYMEDAVDLKTTHVTVAAHRLNIWSILDTTKISLMVGDKYNNPVEENTAVYFTSSGGVVSTHTAYTDKFGKATVVLTAGNPQPTIDRFYNYIGLQDPNTSAILPGFIRYNMAPYAGQDLLPNFEADPDIGAANGETYPGIVAGSITNSEGNTTQNDGIARIIGYTEGKDAAGNSIRPWDQVYVAMTYPVNYDDDSFNSFFVDKGGKLYSGESAQVRFSLIDPNGNPVQSGTTLTANLTNSDAKAKLDWTEDYTGNGMGTCYYRITITSAVTKADSTEQPTGIKISWKNDYLNTRASTRQSITIMPIQAKRP